MRPRFTRSVLRLTGLAATVNQASQRLELQVQTASLPAQNFDLRPPMASAPPSASQAGSRPASGADGPCTWRPGPCPRGPVTNTCA